MERVSSDVDVLRVKDPTGIIHERGQVSGDVLRDVAHEKLAEESDSDGIRVIGIVGFTDHGKPADVRFGESSDVVLSVVVRNARKPYVERKF